MKKEILIYPHEALRKESENCYWLQESNYIETLVQDLKDTLVDSGGIGLSAPQIGKNKRVFVLFIDGEFTEFINPQIIQNYTKQITMAEGCLSLPEEFIEIRRSERVVIYAFRLNGSVATKVYNGLMARAIQHEIEHLDGKLIIDYK